MNAPKSLASEPDDGRPKREGDSCEGRKPAVEPPALPPPANNVLAAPWPPLALELRPAIPAAPIREGEEPTVGPVIEPTGGAGGDIGGDESAGGGVAEGDVTPPIGLETLGREGGGDGDDEVVTRGREGGGGGGDAGLIRGSEGGGGGGLMRGSEGGGGGGEGGGLTRGSEGGGGGGEGGGLTRGSEGGGGSGDTGGGGGGGRIRGVVTVVVGSDGVATVVLGVTGVDGARTVVVGSDGVLTVVVGS
jgi:hypothetical protein